MKTPTSVMYGFCKIFTLDSSLINDLTALAFCFEVMTGRYRCLLIKKIYTKIKHLIFRKHSYLLQSLPMVILEYYTASVFHKKIIHSTIYVL